MSIDYKSIGAWLNDVLKQYNYQVTPIAPSGKRGKVIKESREYTLQLINKHLDTSTQVTKALLRILKNTTNVKNVVYNSVSPNSSKFPSYTFTFLEKQIDIIIAKGANKGEMFEVKTVADLAKAFRSNKSSNEFKDLIDQLNEQNKDFASREITSVAQRKGSTKKEGVPLENLGSVIGDVVLTDTIGEKWFISLKDINGTTFSSYAGAATLFSANGDLQANSSAAKFLEAFGVDLNLVQSGFDARNKKTTKRKHIRRKPQNSAQIKSIFERAWGMNYFYVRKMTLGWQVFWLDRAHLNKLASNIKVTEIRYPDTNSKQITIFCENARNKYIIEIRNAKAGEYPNSVKFKVR